MRFNYILITFWGFAFIKCSFQQTDKEAKQENKTKNIPKTESHSDLIKTSIIKCPKCGYKKLEQLPTEVCVIQYNCEKCNHKMFPKNGDCCVYCTYGTHKCPSKQ